MIIAESILSFKLHSQLNNRQEGTSPVDTHTVKPMGQHNHLRLSLAALCFSLTVLIEGNFVSCSDQKQRGNPFRPRSHVVLRVENYHYEPNKKNEGLKMVLLQEVHEETTHGTAPEGDDDMTNFNDDGANPSSITKTSIKTTTTQLTFPNSLWNRWLIRLDEMDKLIIKSTLPLAAVFSIIPIVLFADLFWVNQLGDSLAVAGQSAANSVYQFAFGLLSFLPTVTATLVSKNHAKGDVEGTQDAIAQALVISFAISLTGTILLLSSPSRFLSFVRVKGKEFDLGRAFDFTLSVARHSFRFSCCHFHFQPVPQRKLFLYHT